MQKKWHYWLVLAFVVLIIALPQIQSWFNSNKPQPQTFTPTPQPDGAIFAVVSANGETCHIPTYSNSPYYEVDVVPWFGEFETTANYEYEYYSNLDELGRCGYVEAAVCTETLPTMPRGEIGNVKPSGWKQAKYDWIDGKYVYNRCHLLGYQLTAENDNPLNLITGTRYLNVVGMLPFENDVADYIRKNQQNHVFLRVTPVFSGDELVCRGIWMQAYSVEDNGKLSFNVFCYNVQPGVIIDYATGETRAE